MYKFIFSFILFFYSTTLFSDYNIRIAVYKNLTELRGKIGTVKNKNYIQQVIIEKRKNLYYAYAYFPTKREAQKGLLEYKKVFSDAFISVREVYKQKVVFLDSDAKSKTATRMTIRRDPKKLTLDGFDNKIDKKVTIVKKSPVKATKKISKKPESVKKKIKTIKKSESVKKKTKTIKKSKPVSKKPKKTTKKSKSVKKVKKHIKKRKPKRVIKKSVVPKKKIRTKKKVKHKKAIHKKAIQKKASKPKVKAKPIKNLNKGSSVAEVFSTINETKEEKPKRKNKVLNAASLLLNNTFYICTDKVSKNSERTLVTMHFKKEYIEYQSKTFAKKPLHIEYSFYKDIVLLRVNGMRSAHILIDSYKKYFLVTSFIGKKKSDVLRYYYNKEDARAFLDNSK